ncbi:phosphotransferase [Kiloniella sp. b19]|uniref:phosphotransferase n=1 Tax=Kiloniella sp. GXU_MW_B19 TaxID=3141326 RepID=UPI0031D05281
MDTALWNLLQAKIRLTGIEDLRNLKASEVTLTRLASRSNQVYRVSAAQASWIVRIPGDTQGTTVERNSEFENYRVLQNVPIAEQPLHVSRDGLLVFRESAGSRLLQKSDLDTDHIFNRLVECFCRLNAAAIPFHNRFDPRGCLKLYCRDLENDGRDIPAPIRELLSFQARAEALYQPLGQAPCHGDPHCGNALLHPDGSISLLDWEYASTAPALWDLSLLSLMEDFSIGQDKAMLDTAKQPADRLPAFHATRFMAALVLLLWERLHSGCHTQMAKLTERALFDHKEIFG